MDEWFLSDAELSSDLRWRVVGRQSAALVKELFTYKFLQRLHLPTTTARFYVKNGKLRQAYRAVVPAVSVHPERMTGNTLDDLTVDAGVWMMADMHHYVLWDWDSGQKGDHVVWLHGRRLYWVFFDFEYAAQQQHPHIIDQKHMLQFPQTPTSPLLRGYLFDNLAEHGPGILRDIASDAVWAKVAQYNPNALDVVSSLAKFYLERIQSIERAPERALYASVKIVCAQFGAAVERQALGRLHKKDTHNGRWFARKAVEDTLAVARTADDVVHAVMASSAVAERLTVEYSVHKLQERAIDTMCAVRAGDASSFRDCFFPRPLTSSQTEAACSVLFWDMAQQDAGMHAELLLTHIQDVNVLGNLVGNVLIRAYMSSADARHGKTSESVTAIQTLVKKMRSLPYDQLVPLIEDSMLPALRDWPEDTKQAAVAALLQHESRALGKLAGVAPEKLPVLEKLLSMKLLTPRLANGEFRGRVLCVVFGGLPVTPHSGGYVIGLYHDWRAYNAHAYDIATRWLGNMFVKPARSAEDTLQLMFVDHPGTRNDDVLLAASFVAPAQLPRFVRYLNSEFGDPNAAADFYSHSWLRDNVERLQLL